MSYMSCSMLEQVSLKYFINPKFQDNFPDSFFPIIYILVQANYTYPDQLLLQNIPTTVYTDCYDVHHLVTFHFKATLHYSSH